MHIAGIIAEYNPFHMGHLYHLQRTKQLLDADYLVVVLSGNFVQRGEPAVFDKSIRAHMALLCGADLVLELPAPFACGSAEDFAMGAVSLLHGLGVVTHLSFGSESGELCALKKAAQIALEEPPAYREALKNALCKGQTYPQARSIAFLASGIDQETAALIEKPNNLLGIEYIKALRAFHSSILPVTLERKGSAYHEEELENGKYASASALRKAIADLFSSGRFSQVSSVHIPGEPFAYTPEELFAHTPEEPSAHALGELSAHAPGEPSAHALGEPSAHTPEELSRFLLQIPAALRMFYHPDTCFPLYLDDFSSILNYQILFCHSQFSYPPFCQVSEVSPFSGISPFSGVSSFSGDSPFSGISPLSKISSHSEVSSQTPAFSKFSAFSQFSDFSPELANRLLRQALTPLSFTERIRSLKTRQYTYTRVSRALLHLMLNIRRNEMEDFRSSGYSSYARILGFKQESSPLLNLIKKHTAIPLISKAADAKNLLPPSAHALWQKDIFCAQVYSLLLQQKYKKIPPDEFRRQIIRI